MTSLLQLVNNHIVAENEQHLDDTVYTFSDDCSYSMDAFKLILSGKEEISRYYATAFSSFPDFVTKNVKLFDAGENVFVDVLIEFTHTREWMGIAPSGNRISIQSMARFPRGSDGRLAGEHVFLNGPELLSQMGVLPTGNAFHLAVRFAELNARVNELEAKLASHDPV